MNKLKFTKQKDYDKGYGWQISYSCGNWLIINIGNGWQITYKNKSMLIAKTLKDAKSQIVGAVAFNEDMI